MSHAAKIEIDVGLLGSITPPSRELLAGNLNRRMTVLGIKNAHVGQQLGVSRELVRQWRRGVCAPSSECQEQLCRILDCSMNDLRLPLYSGNLADLLAFNHLDSVTAARRIGVPLTTMSRWLGGIERPSSQHLTLLTGLLQCTRNDITGIPKLLSISRWAAREDIPVERARSLVTLGLLDGVIVTEFAIMVPITLHVPRNSKRMVAATKRRPIWGAIDREKFAANLTAIMAKRSISDAALANGIGVTSPTVLRWRNASRLPSEERLAQIAKFCTCSITDLLGQPT